LSEGNLLTKLRKLIANKIRFTEFEGKVYFAGGCVRDFLLGRETTDFDLTVELPEGGIRLAEYLFQKGIATQPIVYKQFGTALVTIGNHKIELVMTRRESYRKRCRKPDVEYGSLEEDVLRRDFTVNSLLLPVSNGKILDISKKGLEDLKTKIIRATSKPEIIFTEDPLRMLRAIRFAVQLDFSIEKNTLSQIRKQAAEIRYISRERIADEVKKIIASPNFLKGLKLISETGLKSFVSPGIRLPQALVFALGDNDKKDRRPIRKLIPDSMNLKFALLLWRNSDADKFLRLLKFSSQDVKHINNLIKQSKLIRRLLSNNALNDPNQYRKVAWHSRDYIDEILILYPVVGKLFYQNSKTFTTDLEVCSKLKQAAKQLNENRFNLTGDDLIRSFCIKSSVKVGVLRSKALEYWFKHPKADKKELLDFLKTDKDYKQN